MIPTPPQSTGAAARPWLFALLLGAALLCWTLLMWGSWLLLEAGAGLLEAGSGWIAAWPELLYWSTWVLSLVEQLGVAILGIAWVIGLVAIVVGAWVGRRLWRAARASLGAGTSGAGRPLLRELP